MAGPAFTVLGPGGDNLALHRAVATAPEGSDLVTGDTDGVVVIPAETVAATLDRADARVAAEQQALAAIRSGTTTLEYYKLGALP